MPLSLYIYDTQFIIESVEKCSVLILLFKCMAQNYEKKAATNFVN